MKSVSLMTQSGIMHISVSEYTYLYVYDYDHDTVPMEALAQPILLWTNFDYRI